MFFFRRYSSVFKLCGMRPVICPLSRPSVTETLIVRSKGNSLPLTFDRMSIAAFMGVIALEELAAEPLPRDFDFLGERNLLFAGQQGDFAHLSQVHPHGIVNAAGLFLAPFFPLLPVLAALLFRRLVGEFFIGDDLHPELFDRHQEHVELFGIDRLVRKVIVDLAEGEPSPLPLPDRNQFAEFVVRPLLHVRILQVQFINFAFAQLCGALAARPPARWL